MKTVMDEILHALKLAQDALHMASLPFPVDEVKTQRALEAVDRVLEALEPRGEHMNDDIIRMAREAHGRTTGEWWDMDVAALERFAELVAAPLQERIQDLYRQLNEAERELDSQYKLGMEVEREACAKFFEDHWWETWTDEQIVDAIRART